VWLVMWGGAGRQLKEGHTTGGAGGRQVPEAGRWWVGDRKNVFTLSMLYKDRNAMEGKDVCCVFKAALWQARAAYASARSGVAA